MKKWFMFFVFFLVSCSMPLNDVSGSKEEALEYSLSIVKLIFDNNCETFYASLPNPWYFADGDGPHEKSQELKDDICEGLSKQIYGPGSYEDYVNDYDYKVYEKREYFRQDGSYKYLGSYELTDNDYLFIGSNPKTDIKGYIYDDFLTFIVQKKNNQWKLIAMSE